MNIFNVLGRLFRQLNSYFDSYDETLIITIFGVVSLGISLFLITFGVNKIKMDINDKMGLISIIFGIIFFVSIFLIVFINFLEEIGNFFIKLL